MTVPRGMHDYVTSDDGILALRWKDNRVVTLLSTDMGMEPISSVYRYCSDTKKKETVNCPAVIKSYNANMGGIDKSDMLVHTAVQTGHQGSCCGWPVVEELPDPGVQELQQPVQPCLVPEGAHHFCAPPAPLLKSPKPVWGHHSHTPDDSVRFDMSLFHAPVYTIRQTCKYCSRKGNIL
ncbi:hypothetical protein M9458_057678, partial [Cirrhinus mrigala]